MILLAQIARTRAGVPKRYVNTTQNTKTRKRVDRGTPAPLQYQWIQVTWEAQITERQDRILKILTEIIGRQVGLHQQIFTSGVTPVDNLYKDNLDDLSDDSDTDEP